LDFSETALVFQSFFQVTSFVQLLDYVVKVWFFEGFEGAGYVGVVEVF
jgi:hypothetical protein